jgi:hypothetical protein
MSSFNPNLTYYLERLQGFSTNIFRLESQARTTASPNQIITFDLPSNSIVNLRSFKVFCNVQLTGDNARMPPINDFVERVEVSVGGIVLSQGSNFMNVLQECKKVLGVDYCDAVMSHPEYVRATSYVDGATFADPAPESYLASSDPRFCIENLEGFLSSAEPKLLDTSLIPDLRIRLYMAGVEILSNPAGIVLTDADGTLDNSIGADGTADATYTLSDLHAHIECIGLADATYDNMLSSMMSSQGFLEIPYKAYTSFTDTHTGSSRFTVSTACLDRIWVAWRQDGYDVRGGLKRVAGHKIAGAFVSPTAGTGTADDVGKPTYDLGGVLDTNKEKYRGKYFNFTQPVANWGQQIQLNGAYFPQYSAQSGDTFQITKNSLHGNEKLKNMSLDQYLNNYCCQAYRLNLPDSEYSRLLSGLDTRAVNLSAVLKTTGVIPDKTNVSIFTEQTEVLRVGAGRAVEVIS